MKNRFLNALVKLILVSAITHIIILLIYAIYNLDLVALNYFNILDLDLFFPAIINGTASQIWSAVVMLAIYLIAFFCFTKKSD